MKNLFYIFIALLLSINNLYSQALVTSPCTEPAGAEWTVGAACVATTTAGFTGLFNPASCNSGAFDDGWAWYTGTGAGNTITYTPDPGFDAIIHLFEVPDPAVCSVIELGCSDNAGAGGAETIIGGGVSGVLYYIRIQLLGSNATMTGCLGVAANPATCTDGIQNGTETGVDCGGSCPYGCPPPTTSSTTPCSATINTTVDVITCDLIGTPGFNETAGAVNFSASVKNGIGSAPEPSCGWNIGNSNNLYSTWATYDPLTGVISGSLDAGAISATKDINYAFYDGSCGALTEVGCGNLATISGVNGVLSPVNVSGIDDTQPLYLLLYSQAAFSFQGTLQGFGGVPANDVCASAEVVDTEGCNAGATPSSFIPPSNYNAAICAGGTWYSNENTVYYSFTPTSTDATLEIDNILCNDGSGGGISQFGVWESCAAVNLAPSAANGFLGCVVGTSPLSLSGLTIGQTYYIVVDGNAGSICNWDFAATGGIILPIKLLEFTAELANERVDLDWITESEVNNDYFTIEKSRDGFTFEVVDVISGAGNSSVTRKYELKDDKPFVGTSYYRLKQTDYDGKHSYSEVETIINELDFTDAQVNPNPVENFAQLSFNSKLEDNIEVQIFDVTGKMVLDNKFVANKGLNNFKLETGLLKSGMYFINVNNSKSKKQFKFIKE
jgi:hypothetical protein